MFILEFLPEIYLGIKKLYCKKKYYTILLVFLCFLCFLCIYYDFYGIYSTVALIAFCCAKCVIKIKNDLVYFGQKEIVPITLNCVLQGYNKEIDIKYTDIVKGSSYEFWVGEDCINFFLASPKDNRNYMCLNGLCINSIELSPIYNYGIIFMQKLLDSNHNIFCVRVRFRGFFSPSLVLEIRRC